jgi:hypothetical protein
MSAAFDLIRPGIFHKNAAVEPPLTDILMDFMSNRSFKVQIGYTTSTSRPLSVGCVQISLLGPKLFNIYCRSLLEAFPKESKVITYADDSYIINTANTKHELQAVMELSIARQTEFMLSIGMVVNSSKTELMYSTQRQVESLTIVNGSDSITSKQDSHPDRQPNIKIMDQAK